MKKYIGILVCLALVFMGLAFVQPTLATTYDSSLDLVNKDPSTWAIIGTIQGTLDYFESGNTFAFTFSATGLEATTNYSLIYYANPWPGNNPGKLIGTGLSDGSGGLTISGTPDLNMSLPTPPDSNMVVPHNVPPDNYAHAYGAKIWLVPSSDYAEPAVTSYQPTRFLFETDLINYTDTDLAGTGVPLTTTITEPAATIGLTVSPPSLGFGNVSVGSCSENSSITLTNAGNVPIKVTASTSAGFYTDCLKIENVTANGWISTKIPVGGHLDINVKVCPTIAYNGTITGSVSFVASFAP
ncbi:hypothetical protein MUP46_00745 [Patescibacteria group bacterium]|nr:hypothetical protein [Patescibacteria group bacterium]